MSHCQLQNGNFESSRSSNWSESHLLGSLKDFDSEETDYFYRRKFNPIESIPIC